MAYQNGAFTSNLAIEVPQFHGVTPSIGLNYSSSGGNGFAGVGYFLSGFPEIEREYKGGQKFYRFDGEPLIASNMLGGTHVTKRQAFSKISFVGATSTTAGSWVVTQTNGTVMTFNSVVNDRWGLTKVQDIHGNIANYTWSCDAAYFACYPNTVTYGDTTITLYKEIREDLSTYAIGSITAATPMGTNNAATRRYRLKSVGIKVNGNQASAYKLTYAYSLRTGQSLLKNIQKFGRDSVVSANGSITSGIGLPASTATWSDNINGFDNVVDISTSYGLTKQIWDASIFQNGDFNGDGKDDLLLRYSAPGGNVTAYLLLANTMGGFNNAVNITNLYGMNALDWKYAAINPGDFNGDGKQDLLLQVPYAVIQQTPAQYYAYTLIADENGGFAARKNVTNLPGIGAYGWGFIVRTGDFDGDGKTDLLFPNQNDAPSSGSNPPSHWASLAYADGQGGFANVEVIDNGTLTREQWQVSTLTMADFNGDGITDILAQVPFYYTTYPDYVPNKAFVLLGKSVDVTSRPFSTGEEITNLGGLTNTDWVCGTVTPGDFNADGNVDIILRSVSGCAYTTSTEPKLLYANRNQGTSFASPINITSLYGMNANKWRYSTLLTGDFNGDGRTDLIARSFYYFLAPDHLVLESGKNGFKTALNVNTKYGMTKTMWEFVDRIGDFDGDGDDDVFFHQRFNSTTQPTTPKILKASDSVSNVITSIENGYGSTTSVAYKPGSFWGETSGNPPRTQTATSVTVTDGRGNSATTNYSYTGAAWDPAERRHLGFRSVTATDPTGAYVENYFYQGQYFGLGQVEQSKRFNSGGGLMSRTVRTLTGSMSGTGPWAHLLTKEEISECNGDGTCKTQQKNYTYDSYGNVIHAIEHGDTNVVGDERNTSFTYYPNASNYIVSLPAEEIVRAGPLITGQILRHKRNYYDDGSLTSAPIKGNATRSEQWLNTTGAFIGSTATYDNFGNKLTEADPLGNTNSTTWETTYGRYPLSSTNAKGHVSSMTWNSICGQKATTTDPNMAVTTYSYDNHCRVTQELRADGGHTDTAYVNFGNSNTQYTSTTIDDGFGNTQSKASFFDGLGREWQSFNNNSETVETTYNSRGLVETVSAPFALNETKKRTTYLYDALQRVTRKTFADGNFQQFLYDDWTVTSCDELGKPRTRYSDAFGQIRKVREYVGKTCVLAPAGTLGSDMFDTTIDYDLTGQQTGHTNAKGYASSSVFDSLGRRTSRIDPDMGTWNYVYDDKGRLISQTDAKAQTILLSYDGLDRVVQKSTPAGQSLAYFSYDAGINGIGRRRKMCTSFCADGVNTGILFSYDVMGRIIDERPQINKSYNMNPTVARTYDGAGRVTTLTYPNQEILAYDYDSNGRLNSMVSSAFASNSIVTSATYNARGNLATRTLGNGVVETFTYDPNRFWLTGVSASLGSTLIHSVTLQRNARGEVTSRSNTLETDDNWTYLYDDLRRMTSANNVNNNLWDESFTFDEINRITSNSRLGTYGYGAIGSGKPAYAPQTVGGATLNYDANGNMSSDGVTTLVFDIENRPVNVGGIASTYNPDGERTSVGTVSFTHELSEYDSATGLQTIYYLFGESRVASSVNQQLTFYHGDHLNSASTMTDNVGGVIGRQVLSAYGRKLSTGGYTGPIGLAGQCLDITGLYHMGAREMNPSIGIFVTADPSGAPDPEKPQTLSRYAYANNTPTNLVDPTGYQSEEPVPVLAPVLVPASSAKGSAAPSEAAFNTLSDHHAKRGTIRVDGFSSAQAADVDAHNFYLPLTIQAKNEAHWFVVKTGAKTYGSTFATLASLSGTSSPRDTDTRFSLNVVDKTYGLQNIYFNSHTHPFAELIPSRPDVQNMIDTVDAAMKFAKQRGAAYSRNQMRGSISNKNGEYLPFSYSQAKSFIGKRGAVQEMEIREMPGVEIDTQ